MEAAGRKDGACVGWQGAGGGGTAERVKPGWLAGWVGGREGESGGGALKSKGG